jgi:hypothetical protein
MFVKLFAVLMVAAGLAGVTGGSASFVMKSGCCPFSRGTGQPAQVCCDDCSVCCDDCSVVQKKNCCTEPGK